VQVVQQDLAARPGKLDALPVDWCAGRCPGEDRQEEEKFPPQRDCNNITGMGSVEEDQLCRSGLQRLSSVDCRRAPLRNFQE
jgi:hypothetical protein